MSVQNSQVTGMILAGGKARRMGGMDKGLVELAGRPMCEIVMEILKPQVAKVIINANRNLESYRRFGIDVVPDQRQGYLGPLAGLSSAMKYVDLPWVITAPCDGPFLNEDYVDRMSSMVREGIDVVVASDGTRLQPTFLLVKTELEGDLGEFLDSGGRKIDLWFVKHGYAIADFSDSPVCFLNINTEQDRVLAEQNILKHDSC